MGSVPQFRPHSRARRQPAGTPHPFLRALAAACALLLLAAPVAAQFPPGDDSDDDNAALRAALEVERAARETLEAALAIERSARQSLEQRVSSLEDEREGDSMEAQLRALVAPDAFDTAPPRTTSPSDFNPAIGVYVDTVWNGGNAEEELGIEDGDRFSVRETEIDFSMPFAPWGDATLITAMEDAGDGEFEFRVEEAYANVQLGGMLGNDGDTTTKIGRFRLPFGATNTQHTHDLIQTDRPIAVQELLGEEGLVGDGIGFTVPVSYRENEAGHGRTSTAHVAIVNGEVFTGEEGLLGEAAEDADLELDSDASIFVARWSEFVEVDELSDVEFGASYLRDLGSKAIETDAGTTVEPEIMAFDVTYRTQDDESGVGGWVFQGETFRTDFDYDGASSPDFPMGTDSANGFYVLAQRQVDTNIYVGMRYGDTDSLTSGDKIKDFSPFVSWYPDEFFRVRLQGQHLEIDGDEGVDDVNRVFVQFTWNFGAHRPHPYWVNR